MTAAVPTFAWAVAAAVAMGCLVTLEPRAVPLFRRRFVRLGALGHSPAQLSALSIAFTLAATCLAAYLAVGFRQPWAAVAVAGVSTWGFGWLLAVLIEREERKLRNQLGDFAIAMAGAVRAGLSPAEAIGHAAASTPRPLSSAMTRVFEDYQRGATLRDALGGVRARLSLDAFNLFAAAIGVTLDRGGRLDEALSRIAASLHDQQRLEDKLHALTASGRSAMIVLGLFPFAFAAFFASIDPSGYRVLLSSTTGQISVAIALAAVFIAVRWAKAILDSVG